MSARTIDSPEGHPLLITKVRAGFYRLGAYCIHKGHRWCIYDGPDLMPSARFSTLSEAAWWAYHNQPKATGSAS